VNGRRQWQEASLHRTKRKEAMARNARTVRTARKQFLTKYSAIPPQLLLPRAQLTMDTCPPQPLV
jgi:hypothetical protein